MNHVLLALTLAVTAEVATADHHPGDPTMFDRQRAEYETYELIRDLDSFDLAITQNGGRGSELDQAVFEVRGNTERFYREFGYASYYELDQSFERLRRDFRWLDQVYERAFELNRFPEVQRAEANMRRQFQTLSYEFDGSGGGGGGSGYWICTAVDTGWEEHFGGHQGSGRSNYEAARNATLQCKRYHGNCRVTSCQQRR